MAGQVNNGIAKIEIGAVGADGGMGTTLKSLGYTTEDSVKFTFDDPEKKEYPVEELDTPFFTSVKAGKKSFSFEVANPDIDTLVEVFGGTKTGTGAGATWAAPAVAPVIERSVKITPKMGFGMDFARVLITAKFSESMGRNFLLGVTVTGDVLSPTKAGEPAMKIFNIAAV